MARRRGTGTWYTESGTEERPSPIPGMVELYRAGKLLAIVPAVAGNDDDEMSGQEARDLQDASDEEEAAAFGEL